MSKAFSAVLQRMGLGQPRDQGSPRPRPHRLTATIYAHVRLHLQRNAIDTLSTALEGPISDDGNDPPLCGATVH